MKILFQGDSITATFRKPEERNPAYQLGMGYSFLAACRLSRDHPQIPFEFVNRGVSGHRVQDLQARWQADAADIHADLVSLLVGVNNTVRAIRGVDDIHDGDFEAIYRDLLVRLRQGNPAVRLVLIEPFLLPCGEVEDRHLKHLAPRRAIVRDLAKEFGGHFIPMRKYFDQAVSQAPPSHWIFDGIHPSLAGHQLIADAWLEVVSRMLGA